MQTVRQSVSQSIRQTSSETPRQTIERQTGNQTAKQSHCRIERHSFNQSVGEPSSQPSNQTTSWPGNPAHFMIARNRHIVPVRRSVIDLQPDFHKKIYLALHLLLLLVAQLNNNKLK